jgi:hypothetical protein
MPQIYITVSTPVGVFKGQFSPKEINQDRLSDDVQTVENCAGRRAMKIYDGVGTPTIISEEVMKNSVVTYFVDKQ